MPRCSSQTVGHFRTPEIPSDGSMPWLRQFRPVTQTDIQQLQKSNRVGQTRVIAIFLATPLLNFVILLSGLKNSTLWHLLPSNIEKWYNSSKRLGITGWIWCNFIERVNGNMDLCQFCKERENTRNLPTMPCGIIFYTIHLLNWRNYAF